jgi:hypothetical protein
MRETPGFLDFDDVVVYKQAQEKVIDHKTRNFVVEFGQKNARIAFDIDHTEFEALLPSNHESRLAMPIRWM